MYADFFKGKTVTQLGLGLLGRGVGDAAFLARHCAKVRVTDKKTAAELQVSVDALKEFGNIEFHLGGHDEKLFKDVDFVLKGAGVRLDDPYIATARANNIPVYMSTALFTQLSPLRTIGITGTRGKSSTTHMIVDVLQQGGKKVLLGGNVRGVSTLAQLPEASQFDIAVLELDSWQLQGFDDLRLSPDIAVFTTFYPDHMNYYPDMARYLYDKASIFRHQKADDVLISSAGVAAAIRESGALPPGRWQVVEPLAADFSMQVPGQHNLLNAALAKAAAEAYGVPAATVDKALHQFGGIEGRLQYVRSWQGRTIYNDNNATTQEATLAALTAFPPASVVLIFGGADKGLPIEQMLDYLKRHNIRSVLIKGSGSDRVLQQMPNIQVVEMMPQAVQAACALSRPGDNIVLSPAFASFGAFKNEYDRNDQFMAEIKDLTA